MNEVVIVAYARTPMGSFNGGLSTMTAPALGGLAIKGAMDKINSDSVSFPPVMFENISKEEND